MDGAHTHGHGGGGSGAAFAVLGGVAAAVVAVPVLQAVTELVWAILWAVVTFVALSVISLTGFIVWKWRSTRGQFGVAPEVAERIRAREVGEPARPAIEAPRVVHYHWHAAAEREPREP